MKATLEFLLPEELESFQTTLDAGGMYSDLLQISDMIRAHYKHDAYSADELIRKIQEVINERLN